MSTTKVLCLVGCLLTACLGGYASRAEPEYETKPMTLYTGVMCDEAYQVERLITEISLAGGEWPEEGIEGCGMLTEPLFTLVTPTHWYEVPIANVLIASFEIPGRSTHYGWVAYQINPNFTPAAIEHDT